MRVVVSLGNAALSNPDVQRVRGDLFMGIRNAAHSVHALMDAGHSVVLTHGHEHSLEANDAIKNPAISSTSMLSRFDLQEAQREGLIGYLLEKELRNTSQCKREFVTVMTHILVDENDPAFSAPLDSELRSCVGPTVDEVTAIKLERRNRWTMKRCANGFRREIPSPEPVCVLQSDAIRLLVSSGRCSVICSASGIVISRDVQQAEKGVDALVDKDKTSAQLAHDIGADALLLLTDVPGVYEHWSTPEQTFLNTVHIDDIESLELDSSSMQPKLSAAARFASKGGIAAIGAVGDALAVLSGSSGTRVLM